VKIGPVDTEIALLKLKKERKKLRKVKYIARSAGLPSGLNNSKTVQDRRIVSVKVENEVVCAVSNGYVVDDLE